MRARLVPIGLAGLVLVVAVAVLVVVASRGGAGGRDGLGFLDTRYYQVLYDDHATADDVVDVAGAPDELVRTDDGTEVRLYGINDQEGGDAEKAAVRVQRPGADPVAHLVAPALDVTAVGDHAILHSQDGEVTTVDPDGTLTVVTRNETDADGLVTLGGYEPADGVEPGDVLAGNNEVVTLYRPGTRTVHELPLPERDEEVVPVVAVAAGRAWLVTWDEERARIRSSTDGSTWREVGYDVARDSPFLVAARDDTLAVLDVRLDRPDFEASSVHVVTGDDVRELDVPAVLVDAQVGWTPDGSLLVGADETWYREGTDGLQRLDVPGRVWAMSVAGDDLVAFGDEKAWASPDVGRSWDALDD